MSYYFIPILSLEIIDYAIYIIYFWRNILIITISLITKGILWWLKYPYILINVFLSSYALDENTAWNFVQYSDLECILYQIQSTKRKE